MVPFLVGPNIVFATHVELGRAPFQSELSMFASIPDRYREEQVFIREIWFNPTDVSARLIYADWLEEHGDTRAEILRNDVELLDLAGKAHSALNAIVLDKLVHKRRKLIGPVHWAWVALVGCCPIDTCPSRFHAGELRLRCPMRWENLQPLGDDSSVRFCSECERSVHYCWTVQDADKHSRSGNCVAIDPSVVRNRAYQFETGYTEIVDRDEWDETL